MASKVNGFLDSLGDAALRVEATSETSEQERKIRFMVNFN